MQENINLITQTLNSRGDLIHTDDPVKAIGKASGYLGHICKLYSLKKVN